MKTGIFRAMAAASALLSGGALAAGMSGELRVTGTLAPSRCEIMAPNGGVYDFGRIAVAPGRADAQDRALAPMTQTWQIRCDGATYLAVEPEDNRVGTASREGAAHFGLGGKLARPLGYYRLTLSQPRIDSAPAAAYTAGVPRAAAGGMPLMPGARTQWRTPDNAARSGQQFAADITVSPWLAHQSGPVSEGEILDGSVTLNFIFGL
jgi:hypothetical protein